MVFGIKSKVALKLFIFICSNIIMMGTYSLASLAYKNIFIISSHKNVGMVFISFFFIFIASPILLLSFFTSIKISMVTFALGLMYLFYEWFWVHPLRVALMGCCFLIGYVFAVKMNRYFTHYTKIVDRK